MEPNYIRIAGRYIITRRIGGGSFGEIFLGIDSKAREEVAIKIEGVNCKHPQVLNEARMIRNLKGLGIPKVHWSGTEGGYNIMVIALLGPSLNDVYERNGYIVSLKSLCQLADHMMQRIEYIHDKDYIHRDIKPENFLMGYKKTASIVYLIDFGLAKRFRGSTTKQHIPLRNNKSLTGTARYASINSHIGIEQSRRDDVEAILYVLIYLGQGGLPWQGFGGNTLNEKYSRIKDSKIECPLDKICGGLPGEFVQMLSYVRALKFEERPDYEMIRRLVVAVSERSGFAMDTVYDWTVVAKVSLEKKPRKKSKKHRKDNDLWEVALEDTVKELSVQSTVLDSSGPEFTDRGRITQEIEEVRRGRLM